VWCRHDNGEVHIETDLLTFTSNSTAFIFKWFSTENVAMQAIVSYLKIILCKNSSNIKQLLPFQSVFFQFLLPSKHIKYKTTIFIEQDEVSSSNKKNKVKHVVTPHATRQNATRYYIFIFTNESIGDRFTF
jgi:hypothetical protein